MNNVSRFSLLVRFSLTMVNASFAMTPCLCAQNILFVEHEGNGRAVRAMRGDKPLIEVGGTLVPAKGNHFLLRPIDEFAPFVVSVHNVELAVEFNGDPRSALFGNNDSNVYSKIHLRGEFASAWSLRRCYALFEVASDDRILFFSWELGDLQAHNTLDLDDSRELLHTLDQAIIYPRTTRAILPQDSQRERVVLPDSSYTIHIFSDGLEVFNSQMPPNVIEKLIDEMVVRRLAGVQNDKLRPFLSPEAEYPASLKKADLAGSAVVAFRVSKTGRVLEPVVTSATDPAFGNSALQAIRQYRFLPKVEDGHVLETKVELPFIFDSHNRRAKP